MIDSNEIEKKVKQFKKYYNNKNLEYNSKIENILLEFISDKKLIIYGGIAIHTLLKLKGHKGIYDYKYDNRDYDVMSVNALEDIKELAEIFRKNGFSYIKITEAKKPGTYKIFLDINPESVIDITQINIDILKSLKITNINNILYDDPNHIKVDQYRNLSCQLFTDINRYKKVSERIKLLEKYFPLRDKRISSEKINNEYDISTYKKEYILSGDVAYNFYMSGKLIGEPIIYSSDEDEDENHLNYKEEMLYREYITEDKVIKIASIDLLLHTYYHNMFYEKKYIKNINYKINELVKIRERERIDDIMIFIPPKKDIYVQRISSIYISDF